MTRSTIPMCILIASLFAPGATALSAEKVVLVAGANLHQPFGVDFDRRGNLYFVELAGNRLCKLDAQGALTTIAGDGEKGDRGDGMPATAARFNGPHSLAIAANGDLFIADTWNNRIRKIDVRSGLITTIAGTGVKDFSGDGDPASQAKFGGIYCVAFDPRRERLYLADLDNRRIRVIELPTGIVATVAGNGKQGVPADGAAARTAPLVDPRAVAVDATGNVYVLERGGHALRVVDPSGKIRTLAGTGKAGAGLDPRQPCLNGPKHLCIDRDGNVVIADTENHRILRYSPADGKLVRVAGAGKKGAAGLDGPPDRLELNQPHGVAVDSHGTLFIADSGNNRVLKIVP
jgi:DNA-binding beta-propeller fold protein YncE